MIKSATDILVPFHDVDSMQVAWHGHYAKYLEVARCELLERIGYSYSAMRDSGYAWPIVDMRIKYIGPVVFNQTIRVECELVEWEHRLKIHYVIRDARSGAKLTKAHTTQVAVEMSRQELQFESPPIVREKIAAYMATLVN